MKAVEERLLREAFGRVEAAAARDHSDTFVSSFLRTYAQRYVGILAAFTALLPAVYNETGAELSAAAALADASVYREGVTTYFLTCLHLLIGIGMAVRDLFTTLGRGLPRAKVCLFFFFSFLFFLSLSAV